MRRFSWIDAAEVPLPVNAPVWAVLEPVGRRSNQKRHVELVVRNYVGGLYYAPAPPKTKYFYHDGELVDKYLVTHWRPLIAPELPQKKKQPVTGRRKVKKR